MLVKASEEKPPSIFKKKICIWNYIFVMIGSKPCHHHRPTVITPVIFSYFWMTPFENWSIYKYRIIQKMFCVNILGHSIPDLSINIFGSIPAFHWSPLGFAKNGQNGWSFNRYLRLRKIKETFRIWCKLWWEPKDILQASLSSFCVEKRKQSKRKLMHDDSDLACYFPRF